MNWGDMDNKRMLVFMTTKIKIEQIFGLNLLLIFQPQKKEVTKSDIMDRLLFAQVVEAIWCLQEKVIKTVAEANLGSIHGWGFPRFKGGAIQFVNDYGRIAFIEKCKEFEEKYGERFRVPGLIEKGDLPSA